MIPVCNCVNMLLTNAQAVNALGGLRGVAMSGGTARTSARATGKTRTC